MARKFLYGTEKLRFSLSLPLFKTILNRFEQSSYLRLGVVHTLPSKYASGIFMRGSEWHRVYHFTTLPKKQLSIVFER